MMVVVRYESCEQSTSLLIRLAIAGTAPGGGVAIDSISLDREWVPRCFADEIEEIWLRYCRDKIPIHYYCQSPHLKLFCIGIEANCRYWRPRFGAP